MKINDFLHYSSVPYGTSGEKDIFGKKEDGLEYVYSDRLLEWDYKKHEFAKKKNDRQPHTSEWYKKYLSSYYGRKIDLRHIRIGVNVSTGYDYLVFGFKNKKCFLGKVFDRFFKKSK